MIVLLPLIFLAFFGYLSYTVAKKNGRDTVMAFFVGMFFGIFGWILYLILGKTEELKEKERAEREEK